MRCRGIASVVLLLLVTLAPLTAIAAESSGNDYFTWAVKSSNELDATWNRLTAAHHSSSVTGSSPFSSSTSITSNSHLFKRNLGRSANSGSVWNTSNTRNTILTTGNYTHRGKNNTPFLPLSTRKRSGATRGSGMLRNPAHAHLAVSYKRLRPTNSSTQTRRIFSGIRGHRRPPMRSINIMPRRRYRRTASRPAYRASRPRMFKSIF